MNNNISQAVPSPEHVSTSHSSAPVVPTISAIDSGAGPSSSGDTTERPASSAAAPQHFGMATFAPPSSASSTAQDSLQSKPLTPTSTTSTPSSSAPAAKPAVKRFMYDPRDLLLPHERAAQARAQAQGVSAGQRQPASFAHGQSPASSFGSTGAASARQQQGATARTFNSAAVAQQQAMPPPPPYSSIPHAPHHHPSSVAAVRGASPAPNQTAQPASQASAQGMRTTAPSQFQPNAGGMYHAAPGQASPSIDAWAKAIAEGRQPVVSPVSAEALSPSAAGSSAETRDARATSWDMEGVGAAAGPAPPRTMRGSADAVMAGPSASRRTAHQDAYPREDEMMDVQEEEEEAQRPAGLSDWEIVETLGTGTFGRVLLVRLRPYYRARSYHPIFPHLQQPLDPISRPPEETIQEDKSLPHYAMKVLAKSEIVRLKQVEHINSERAILERVRHPFLVELYGTYQDHLNVYMLLSYVPGGELFSHLRRAGRFTADVTRFYLASIILAIDYLHKKDIIYRDLKPENLLLDRSGYLRIADFGFAKVVEDRTFTLCGTPEYLAPEIVLSKGHGKAVDWWALGILCFEMLAGYPPFFDDHPLGIYEKILANRVAFPAHIDPYAKDLIRRLLTPDRSRRLGNLRGGAQDVMNHHWFTGVDWNTLESRQIAAPIIPHVASQGDCQNFQRYPPPRPEELPGILGIQPSADTPDPYKHLFADFVFPPQ